MVTNHVKSNVTTNVTRWEKALSDAEHGLEKAQQDAAQWKGTVAVIRDRIKHGAPWPGEQSDGRGEARQRSV